MPVEDRADFELFAYRLYLVVFADGREEPMEEWYELPVEPMPRSFVRLGWDAVEGGKHQSFGCSPMSCNAGCDIVEIANKNRYCLVSTEEVGIDLARHFSICQPEPGPYRVVEVWRETPLAFAADILRAGLSDPNAGVRMKAESVAGFLGIADVVAARADAEPGAATDGGA